VTYFRLLRPKDWAKNLFLFLPSFFAGRFYDVSGLEKVGLGFLAYCMIASCIYIVNDYLDIEDDRNHPVKKNRPLASGAVTVTFALCLALVLALAGFSIAWFIRDKFAFILAIYFIINICYSAGLKNIPILDIFILASGFVLRIKAGSVITRIPLSEWIMIMVFLLSIFMAIGKRRDDVLIKVRSGTDMRKSIKGYNLELLDVLLSLVAAVIIVSYLMYTLSPEVKLRLGTYRLYYTCVFVMAGIMRYLQIIYVQADSGSPTRILYKDRFIQVTLLLWIASFVFLLYFKNITVFK
jgi:4-hydroxybenzoate polyprenyltransferase